MGQVKKLYQEWLEESFPRHLDDDGQEQEELRAKQEIENWSMDFDAFISKLIASGSAWKNEHGDASSDVQGNIQNMKGGSNE